jgi:gliding motility-associated-like protein
VYDSCEKKHLTSNNFARTIHLAGEIGTGSTITLQWNPYEGWENGIEKYELYREVDGVSDTTVELSGAVTSYDDNIADLTGGEGNFSYYLKAFEKDGNNAMSQSNKVTIELESSIDIPNAFIPGGPPPDHEFKPIVDFIEQGFYQMLIFNKWGQQIFESNSVDTGWDGKYENDYVPAGTYVYMISFRNARGETVEKRGTVSVLR